MMPERAPAAVDRLLAALMLAVGLAPGCVQGPPAAALAGTFGAARGGVLAEATAVRAAEPVSAARERADQDTASPAAANALPPPTAAAPASSPPAATTEAVARALPDDVGDPDPADAALTERALRHELATAADPTLAACRLAALLAARERHDDALFVIDTALRRTDTVTLHVARAGLLRDLARRALAIAELRGIVRNRGVGALAPETLCDLAELEWMAGERDLARDTLRQLREHYAADRWVVEHRDEIDELAAEVERALRPERTRLRDELANLRGAPTVTLRLRLLDQFAARAPVGADAELAAELRARAVAIACADPSPAVRARAVQLAQPAASAAASFWRAALADPSPLVRRFAAEGAAAQLGAACKDLLRAQLSVEADAGAFAALHRALLHAAPPAPPVPGADATTPAGRAEVLAFWQEQWVP